MVSRWEKWVVNILVRGREDCGGGGGLGRKRRWRLRFNRGYWGKGDFWMGGKVMKKLVDVKSGGE